MLAKMFTSIAGWFIYFLFIKMYNQVADTTVSIFLINFPVDSRHDQHLIIVNLKTNHNL